MALLIGEEISYLIISQGDLSSCSMKTYRVTLKISDANGDPVIREIRGSDHVFSGNPAIYLNIQGEKPNEIVAIFPGGEYAAVEIIEDAG